MRNAQLKASFPWLEDYVKVPRQAHSTKAGPGRRHVDGQPHGTGSKASTGAPLGFVLHTNTAKRARRDLVAKFGIRQVKKLERAARG